MKTGLRNQFRQILEIPEIRYLGNLSIGANGDLPLDELRSYRF